jgi:hypothetical protein
MIQNKEMSLTTIASKAYDKALAPHHNWFIKKAAKMGMVACASRNSFLTSICEEQ